MRDNREKLAFLFGVDDYWGPLQMYEEVCDGLHMFKHVCFYVYVKGLIVFLKGFEGILC